MPSLSVFRCDENIYCSPHDKPSLDGFPSLENFSPRPIWRQVFPKNKGLDTPPHVAEEEALWEAFNNATLKGSITHDSSLGTCEVTLVTRSTDDYLPTTALRKSKWLFVGATYVPATVVVVGIANHVVLPAFLAACSISYTLDVLIKALNQRDTHRKKSWEMQMESLLSDQVGLKLD